MNGIAGTVLKPMLMSAGIYLVAPLAPARAELDVAKLKASIETSVEADDRDRYRGDDARGAERL